VKNDRPSDSIVNEPPSGQVTTPIAKAPKVIAPNACPPIFGTLPGDAAHSAGIQGIQFASVGGRIYELAKRQGLGQDLPMEMFLQDIPT
jgi:hypothetical protein